MAPTEPTLTSLSDAIAPPAAHAAVAPATWLVRTLRRWFDTGVPVEIDPAREDRIDWLRAAPFVAMHLACIGVLWVGVSPVALGVAAALYAVRMFALTGFYHRYFSHRSFRTSRGVQFVFALIGGSCVQARPAVGGLRTTVINHPACRHRPRPALARRVRFSVEPRRLVPDAAQLPR